MGQIALSDFEYLPRQREEGGPWVVLHSCAYNHSSALPEDKKKYILLNKSSLEQQEKKTQGFKKGKQLAWEGWGTIGNPVFPLRPHRFSSLARA